MIPQDLIAKVQARTREDPVFYLDHVLGCTHWSKQDEIIRAVFKYQKVTVKSCHGVGKSYISARIGLAYLHTYPDSIVITTAPTFRQVQDIIWREWRGAHQNALISLGESPLKVVHEISENWYAKGISSNRADNVQGIHAKSGHMLVIVDEAAGVDQETLMAVQALLTSRDVHLLYIGNPTVGYGAFFDSHKSNSFHKISVDIFDTPNFKINRIKNMADLKKLKIAEEVLALPLVYPQLVTPKWAWDRLEDWGETTPIYQARVLAQFPEEGSDTLIPLHLAEKAILKKFTDEELLMRPRNNVIGIDVARFGEDTTVFTVMDNLQHLETDWHAGKDTMQTVGKAIALFNKYGFKKEFDKFVVDDTGLGGGVTDRLVELGYNVLPINNAGSSSDPEMYINIKAEIFWHLRQIFLNGEVHLLDIGKTLAQLPMIRYDYKSKGQLFIVPKAQMKKDGLPSPDFADSFALACWGVKMGSSYGQVDVDKGKGHTVGGNIMSKTF